MAGQLKMSFDPMTIEHLGVRMYSTLPPVLSELIANSSDADATKVDITLKDADGIKEIVVEDDGEGMTFDELNEKFLRIGRNRRETEHREATTKGRKIIGKKGLGKLSFFGIAGEIEVVTRKGGKENVFLMRWEDIKTSGTGGNEYEPTPVRIEEDCDVGAHGTTITLRSIDRVSDFQAAELATSLSKIFITDPAFTISIKHNGDDPIVIENERRYESLDKEVEWAVPVEIEEAKEYLVNKKISGHLIATKTPIPPKTNMRGVTLFSRKKLVNLPEYFSDSTSSHFYSYLTGWLEVDFIDDLPEDVIATNRQSLNWDHPEMVELRDKLRALLNWLERDWRKKRKEKRKEELEEDLERTGVDISDWLKNVPSELNEKLNPILEIVVGDSEFSEEEVSGIVKNLKDLIPPYTYYHYQNLHPILSSEVFDYYKDKDYYNAVAQGVIKYIREIQKKSASTLTDFDLIKHAFSPDRVQPPLVQALPELSVTQSFKRPDGTDFEQTTVENITVGHGLLARAIWKAFRNPIHHELAADLRDSGLYSEQDCLDALGLLSHLFRRLDSSV